MQEIGSATHTPHLENDVVVLKDGAALPFYRWLPSASAPRGVIVAVHGLNDYGDSFADVARFLNAQGFAVYAYDQRGFGTTEQRGLWPGGDQLADDAYAIAQLVRAAHPTVPLFGLGESMGGAVIMRALTRHRGGWLDGAALLAPAVWGRAEMPWYQRFALRTLSHTWRGLRLSGRGLGLQASDNPAALERLHTDPLIIKKTRVDLLWGIADLMDAVTAQPSYEIPLLILYGAHDEIVPKRPTCAWVDSLAPNGDWQLGIYPNGWHLLAHDLGASVVLEDLTAWYSRPRSALPSRLDSSDARRALCTATADTRRAANRD